jgi:HAMP domain-containing protein
MALSFFDWRPFLLVALAAVVAALLWRLWIWYRRRASRALDPLAIAEREFARVEAMKLIEKGEAERHAALMSDVLRDYLAARVDAIERSHTSSEVLANAAAIHAAAPALGELLWRTDLVKFANNRIPGDEAERLGASAKSIVRSVEASLAEADNPDDAKAA